MYKLGSDITALHIPITRQLVCVCVYMCVRVCARPDSLVGLETFCAV